LLHAVRELAADDADPDEVLAHLSDNIERFYDPAIRALLVEVSAFMGTKIVGRGKLDEASAARVLAQLLTNQKL